MITFTNDGSILAVPQSFLFYTVFSASLKATIEEIYYKLLSRILFGIRLMTLFWFYLLCSKKGTTEFKNTMFCFLPFPTKKRGLVNPESGMGSADLVQLLTREHPVSIPPEDGKERNINVDVPVVFLQYVEMVMTCAGQWRTFSIVEGNEADMVAGWGAISTTEGGGSNRAMGPGVGLNMAHSKVEITVETEDNVKKILLPAKSAGAAGDGSQHSPESTEELVVSQVELDEQGENGDLPQDGDKVCSQDWDVVFAEEAVLLFVWACQWCFIYLFIYF